MSAEFVLQEEDEDGEKAKEYDEKTKTGFVGSFLFFCRST